MCTVFFWFVLVSKWASTKDREGVGRKFFFRVVYVGGMRLQHGGMLRWATGKEWNLFTAFYFYLSSNVVNIRKWLPLRRVPLNESLLKVSETVFIYYR